MPDDPTKLVKTSPLARTAKSKRFVKLLEVLDHAITPDGWIPKALEELKGKNYTQEEMIAVVVNYCLITNTRFVNSALLKEILDRKIGKVPLRVLTTPEETPEEFDALTDEEYEARKQQLLKGLDANGKSS